MGRMRRIWSNPPRRRWRYRQRPIRRRGLPRLLPREEKRYPLRLQQRLSMWSW